MFVVLIQHILLLPNYYNNIILESLLFRIYIIREA